MRYVILKKRPTWSLLVAGLFVGLHSIYAYVTGSFVIIGRYTHGSVIYKATNPGEFSGWLKWSAISSLVICISAFVTIIPLENVGSLLLAWVRASREEMMKKSPARWVYMFWGVGIALTIWLIYWAMS